MLWLIESCLQEKLLLDRLAISFLAKKIQSKFCPVLHFYMDENFKKKIETINLINKAVDSLEEKNPENHSGD